ncbi:MAG: hypothetical protein MHPSP_001163, partial [Paramarteilia canceri]
QALENMRQVDPMYNELFGTDMKRKCICMAPTQEPCTWVDSDYKLKRRSHIFFSN